VNCKLVLVDWQNEKGESIYSTELGAELSVGMLHAGTTFDVEISFHEPDAEAEIVAAMRDHNACPVFKLLPDNTVDRCYRRLLYLIYDEGDGSRTMGEVRKQIVDEFGQAVVDEMDVRLNLSKQ